MGVKVGFIQLWSRCIQVASCIKTYKVLYYYRFINDMLTVCNNVSTWLCLMRRYRNCLN